MKRLLVFLAVFGFIFHLSGEDGALVLAAGESTEISGTVSLPVNMPAFAEDKTVEVYFKTNWTSYPDSSDYGYFQGSTYCGAFTLLANQTTVSYQCTTADLVGEIAIEVKVGMDGIYHENYYYLASGITWRSFNADAADYFTAGQKYQDIDITLLEGIIISGTIQTPNGLTFTEHKTINVFWGDKNDPTGALHNIWGPDQLNSGSSSLDYELSVPANISSSLFVGYTWFGGGGGLVGNGYYNDTGTVYSDVDATPLDGTNDLESINMTMLEGIPLTGTIGLPDGVVNSVDMEIYIQATDSETWESLDYQTITLPAGSNSTGFTITLVPGHQTMLYYSYSGSNSDSSYWSPGYYSANGSVLDSWGALVFPSGSPPDQIDLRLIPGVTLSGTVVLPDGDTFTQPVQGYIGVYPVVNDDFYGVSQEYSIQPGNTSETWEIVVPENLGDVVLQAILYKEDFGPRPSYLDTNYYNSNGSTGLRENAELLKTSTDSSGLVLDLLKGNTISGTISLQDSDVFVSYGSFAVYVWGADDYRSKWINYEANDISVDFSFAIPVDAPDYSLQYSWHNRVAPYTYDGFYNSSQTSLCQSDAELFTSGIDYTNINIEMAKSHMVAGTISLPSGVTETEDLSILVGLQEVLEDGEFDGRFSRAVNVTIPSGTNQVSYTLDLPVSCEEPPTQYLVGYRQTNDDYVRLGYHSNAGTVGWPKNADEFAVDQSYTGIDLQLMTGSTIAGTISLPGGETAPPEGLQITLGTLSEPSGLYHTTVTIDSGMANTQYNVRVAPDMGNAVLGYWLLDNTSFATRGYFSSTKGSPDSTSGRFDFADQFSSESSTSDKDFTLSFGQEISGIVYTPAVLNNSVPVLLTLAVDPENLENVYLRDVVNVPAGSQSAFYSHRIILDSDIVAQFTNSTETQWSSQGFFFDNMSSVASINDATRLTAGSDHLSVDLFLLEMLQTDIDGDGAITLKDAVLGLQILTGLPTTENVVLSADVDGDGKLGLQEVISIMNQLQN